MSETRKEINNRDIAVLGEVMALMHEVKRLENQLLTQRESMFHITQKLNDMPTGKGMHRGIDDLLARYNELELRLLDTQTEHMDKLKQQQRIIDGIESVRMRAFVCMVYVENCSKADVMRELQMSDWQYRSARDSVEQASSMRTVVWREKYMLKEGNG